MHGSLLSGMDGLDVAEWGARQLVAGAFDLLWQAALLGLVVAGLLRLWDRGAAGRSAVWTLAVVLMPFLPFVGGLWNLAWHQMEGPMERPVAAEGISALPAVERDGQLTAPVNGNPPLHLPPGRWPLVLAGVWGVGTALLLLRLGLGWYRLTIVKKNTRPPTAGQQAVFAACKRRLGIRRTVRLGLSVDVKGPVAVGLYRPAVLLPVALSPGLSAADLERVLLHELAHIHRCDDWGKAAQQVVGALLWFLPLLWWINRRLDLEREVACDEWVVHLRGQRRDYALCLVGLAQWAHDVRRVATVGAAGGPGQLRRRVERILANTRPQPRLGWRGRTGAVLLAVSLSCALGAAAGRLVDPADAISGSGLALEQLRQALAAGDAALYARLLDRDFLFTQSDCRGQVVQYIRRREELRLITGNQGVFAHVGSVVFDFDRHRVYREAGRDHPGAYAGDPQGHPQEDWMVFEGRARLAWPGRAAEDGLLQEMTFKMRPIAPHGWKIVRWQSALPITECTGDLAAVLPVGMAGG